MSIKFPISEEDDDYVIHITPELRVVQLFMLLLNNSLFINNTIQFHWYREWITKGLSSVIGTPGLVTIIQGSNQHHQNARHSADSATTCSQFTVLNTSVWNNGGPNLPYIVIIRTTDANLRTMDSNSESPVRRVSHTTKLKIWDTEKWCNVRNRKISIIRNNTQGSIFVQLTARINNPTRKWFSIEGTEKLRCLILKEKRFWN